MRPTMSLPELFAIDHSVLVVCLTIHCLLAATLYWIVLQYLWHRRAALEAESRLLAFELPPDDALPHVLIQLPTYNEGPLIRRVATAVGDFNWPRHHLHVQILDDSTDGSSAESEEAVAALGAKGIGAVLIARRHRAGFKAGALAEGLRCSREPFVAILDADYMPDPDFLRNCMRPMLQDEKLALVQARCDYLNPGDNLLTYAQQRILDGHFAVEQAARSWSGQVLPFNGTCGVWRRAAIDEAGGWQGDTLAEDLDLSYRAQLAGWRAQFLSTVAVKGELPQSMQAWRQQQFRWTKGFAEVGRKLLWRVWTSRLSPGQKLVSTLHLGSGLLGPLVALTAVTAAIDWVWGSGLTWPVAALLIFSLAQGVIIGPAATVLASQVLVRGASLSSELPRLPVVIGLQMASGLANLGGTIEALLGHDSVFERTPKTTETSVSSAQEAYAPGTRP